MKFKGSDIAGITMVIIILIAILLFFLGIGFIFSGGLLSLLGLKYNSLWTLLKFFALYFISNIIINFFIEGISLILKELKGLSDIKHDILNFCMSVSADIVILSVLAATVKGIYMKPQTLVLFPIIVYLVNYYIDKKLKENLDK